MPYAPTRRTRRYLRSPEALDAAMEARAVSARGLAEIVTARGETVSRETLNRLRAGTATWTKPPVASAIEWALAVPDGALFGPPVGSDR
jgi:hypothetical protein